MSASDDELIEIAKPILAELEDRRGIKQTLNELHWSNDALDQEIYREIQLMIGRFAWEGVHKILNDPSNNDE